MSAYARLTSAFSSSNFNYIGVLLCFGGGGYYYWTNRDKKVIYNHPTREVAEMLLRNDPRVMSYYGRNFRIKQYYRYVEEKDQVTYRMKISGIHEGKVAIKCEKSTHEKLQRISDEQTKYTKLSRDQKLRNPFSPVNFNDYLVPNTDSVEKMKSLLSEKEFDFNNKKSSGLINLFDIDKLDFEKGVLPSKDDTKYGHLNTEIERNSEFWRFTYFVVASNDSIVFNIRPIGAKYRDYDIENTEYSMKTYYDVMHKIMKLKLQYEKSIKIDLTSDELRNELISIKNANFENRLKWRKYAFFFNGVILVGFMTFYQVIHMRMVDHSGLNIASAVVKNNSQLFNILGKNNVVFGFYRNRIFSRDIDYKMFVMGVKGNAWVNSHLLYDARNNTYAVSKIRAKSDTNQELDIDVTEEMLLESQQLSTEKNKQEPKVQRL